MSFLNSASSAAALVFYLPGVCTHIDTEENRERPESGIFLKIRKNTIFNEQPVFKCIKVEKISYSLPTIHNGPLALSDLQWCHLLQSQVSQKTSLSEVSAGANYAVCHFLKSQVGALTLSAVGGQCRHLLQPQLGAGTYYTLKVSAATFRSLRYKISDASV